MKNIRIGIVGAESTHTFEIAKLINIEHKIKNCSIDYVWGETSQLAYDAAQAGQIPNIVDCPEDMIGKIDAVAIVHRHCKNHIPAAMPFVEAGLPIFIDKPFCYDVDEGLAFIDICRTKNVPIASFSVLPLQKSFVKMLRRLKLSGKVVASSIQGTCDINSPYGGVFFLGVHHVEMALNAFGSDVRAVVLNDGKKAQTAQLFYDSGLAVTLNLMSGNGYKGYAMSVAGTELTFAQKITFDANLYYRGIKKFTDMFKTSLMPQSYESLIEPVRILKGLEASLYQGCVDIK